MHYGRNSKWSKGCIVSPDIDKIRALIDDEYNNGGVKLAVVDTCDKEPRKPPKPRKYRTINWKAYIKHKYGIEDVEVCPGTE